MRMVRDVLVAAVLLTFPFPCFGDEQAAETFKTLAAKIKPAVVTILLYDSKGSLNNLGSGFFYSENGQIVTNHHVLAKNGRVEVKTMDGKKYRLGPFLERNKTRDFVKAKVYMDEKTPYLKIAKSRPAVGDKIMVAGSPMGLEQTITEGIVSAWRKHPDMGRVIQISAPVSPGSSGGPVLNMDGEVVGIATFQMLRGQNLNFAVPVETIFNKKKIKQKKLEFYKDENGVTIIRLPE